ncbi:hypothetical protein ES703_101338 [subsurface metagenome]
MLKTVGDACGSQGKDGMVEVSFADGLLFNGLYHNVYYTPGSPSYTDSLKEVQEEVVVAFPFFLICHLRLNLVGMFIRTDVNQPSLATFALWKWWR